MTTFTMLKRPSAFVPLVMSSAACLLVIQQVVRFGTAPQADEGTAAHIWQILMAVQLPLIVFFAVRWWHQAPRQTAIIVAIQLATIAAATAPILLLGW